MDKKEAIGAIRFILDVGGSDGFTSRDKEALNLAINALSETKQPKTNADRIRQMTDEELAESLGLACKRCAYYKVGHGECSGHKECTDGNLAWLKQEVKTND